MDIRTASRIGRSGLVVGLQYSEHIRLRLVTTIHNSRPHLSNNCAWTIHDSMLEITIHDSMLVNRLTTIHNSCLYLSNNCSWTILDSMFVTRLTTIHNSRPYRSNNCAWTIHDTMIVTHHNKELTSNNKTYYILNTLHI